MSSRASDILCRISPEIGISLCSLAAEKCLTVEQVITDLIYGNYNFDTGEFLVHFPDQVGMAYEYD